MEEVRSPNPRSGSVLVKTELASICGSDLHVVYSDWKTGQFPMPHGYPGHEGIGRVVDSGGTHFNEGELVLTVPKIHNARTFAGYQLIDPGQLIKIHSEKPIDHLLMAQQLGTVMFSSNFLPDLHKMVVVILGQGTAGLFHSFVAKQLGALKVIAIDPITHRLEIGKSMGADESIDVTGAEATEAVLNLTGGMGADVVIEAVGSIETLNQTLELSKPRGLIIGFGLPTTSQRIPFNWDLLFSKSLAIHAIHGAQDEPGLPDFQKALSSITNSEIDVSRLITHQFNISRVDEAFELARSKKNGVLKVSLTFE